MDRLSHTQQIMGWNYSSIPKLPRLNRWILAMDWQFHSTLCNGCNYLSMLGFKLDKVSKRNMNMVWHIVSLTDTMSRYLEHTPKKNKHLPILFGGDTTIHCTVTIVGQLTNWRPTETGHLQECTGWNSIEVSATNKRRVSYLVLQMAHHFNWNGYPSETRRKKNNFSCNKKYVGFAILSRP